MFLEKIAPGSLEEQPMDVKNFLAGACLEQTQADALIILLD